MTETAIDRLNEALDGVNPSAPSTSKFRRLDFEIAQIAHVPAAQVVASTVSKAGNFGVRAVQSPRAMAATILVGVVTNSAELEGTKAPAMTHVSAGRAPVVLLMARDDAGRWHAPWGVAADNADPAITGALASSFGTEWVYIAQELFGANDPVRVASDVPPAVVPLSHPLVIDARIMRMFKTAVASRQAVMLVGPPGTGKTRMVEELLREVAEDPTCVGMTQGHDALITTPDESWTARELVGGETVDDSGRLRFAPGVVLDAITQDRWLVLDEANRADMDRIFGALLTWLSGQRVIVGRTSGDPGAGPVELGWTENEASQVDGLERLRTDDPGPEPVMFLAGTEWRLIGTYNALDAQRVFRFGAALGRRFAHVPVPALTTADFGRALLAYLDVLPEDIAPSVGDLLVRIYGAHQATEAASIGPAAFLAMPSYMAHGLRAGAGQEEVLAEAYLASVGAWLSRLEDPDLDALGVFLSGEVLPTGEWDWVRRQLSAFR